MFCISTHLLPRDIYAHQNFLLCFYIRFFTIQGGEVSPQNEHLFNLKYKNSPISLLTIRMN